IYILLSGGMDSRVVAAVIKKLERNNEFEGKVHGVTWGRKESRDVVYAQNICSRYGWEWHYAPLDANYLLKNFNVAGIELNAEISPVHVHRYTWFQHLTQEDIVIAGSYGDSIGRGEYSSVKVARLKP